MVDGIIQKNTRFDPIITAEIKMSLNQSEYQYFFDPSKDLSRISKDTPAYLWIKPFENY